jgi:16S rRNA processing protein RimM
MANDPDRFLAIGRLVRPQGRHGELAAEILTDFPERFGALREAFLENPGQEPSPVTVERAWPHKGRIILKLRGVDSITAASQLRGRHVLIPREAKRRLPPDHYYRWELEGCQVVAEREGKRWQVGKVVGVEPTGGVDVLHIAARAGEETREVLIPLAQAICTRIDTAGKTIVIDPPQDLLELNEDL